MSEQKDKYLINSVLRATQVLNAFTHEKSSFTHTELSKTLGINNASLTRILYTLIYTDFLEKDLSTGNYRLTVKSFQIGSVYLSKVDFHTAAMPHLSELSAQYGETSNLAILNGNEVFFIDRVESSQSIRLKSNIGSKLPAYCTALGKVLLAYQDNEFIDQFLQSTELKKYTPTTITEPKLFKEHLNEIKNQGYAIDNNEHQPEFKSTAAPIMDNTGKVIAGISIIAPAHRMQDTNLFNKLIDSIIETADKISHRLGYMPTDKVSIHKNVDPHDR